MTAQLSHPIPTAAKDRDFNSPQCVMAPSCKLNRPWGCLLGGHLLPSVLVICRAWGSSRSAVFLDVGEIRSGSSLYSFATNVGSQFYFSSIMQRVKRNPLARVPWSLELL